MKPNPKDKEKNPVFIRVVAPEKDAAREKTVKEFLHKIDT